MFIDTHAHIFMDSYDSDRQETVARARAAGVLAINDVGLDIETNRLVLDNAARFDGVYAIIGFHPHEATKFDAAEFEKQVMDNLGNFVALGEFGLDYFKEYSPRDAQIKVLEQCLDIAKKAKSPIVLHCRNAEDALMPILRSAGAPNGGVMHCFSGDTDFLNQTLDLGLLISVGGPATYPKADKLERVLRAVPRERLLLETDCPFLSPQKLRGKRNEPANIPIIAARVAEIWNVSPETVGEITTKNAVELFGIEI